MSDLSASGPVTVAPPADPPAPGAPTPPAAPPKPSLLSKLRAVVAWANSRAGRTEIAAAVGVIGAIYTTLHRAGL